MNFLIKMGTAIGAAVLAIFIGGIVILVLWNWLMPELFGLKQIGFWQAIGISMLSAALFKHTGKSS